MQTTLAKIRSLASDEGGRARTNKVLLACIYYFSHYMYSCYPELGVERWGKRRMDLLCLHPKQDIVGVEIKQSIADFRGDNKYTDYLPYCNKMYFAFPEDLYSKYEQEIRTSLDKDIGILVLSEKTGLVYTARKAKIRDISGANKKSIVMRMAWRGGISKRITKRYKVL